MAAVGSYLDEFFTTSLPKMLLNMLYPLLSEHYEPLKAEDPTLVPRVLALSASIVPSKCTQDQFIKKKVELEELLDSDVITASALRYVTDPEQDYVLYDKTDNIACVDPSGSIEELQKICHDYLEACTQSYLDKVSYGNREQEAKQKLKKYKKHITSFVEAICTLGLYCGDKMMAEAKNQLRDDEAKSFDLYERSMIGVVKIYYNEFEELIKTEMSKCSQDKLWEFSTNKVKALLKVLEDPFNERSNMKYQKEVSGPLEVKQRIVGIIFVQQRILATSLAYLLGVFAQSYHELAHIRPAFAVGGNLSEAYRTPGGRLLNFSDDRRKLEGTLSHFRSGKVNCVVAKQVLDEGLDVHQCKIVIRFDGIQTFRSYVQSKGRARARETEGYPSRYLMFVEKGSLEEQKLKKDVEGYRSLEAHSVQLCHANATSDDSDEDSSDEENETYYADPDDKINSPYINKHSSISLLHRYTQNLPTDRFTKLSPYLEIQFVYNERHGRLNMENTRILPRKHYRCMLHMPHLTPYSGKPFKGPACKTRPKARRMVALDACK